MNDFKIPDIAQGKVVPLSIQELELKEAKEKDKEKQQRKHNWKIAFFNVFGGAIAGLITSIIFWLITEK